MNRFDATVDESGKLHLHARQLFLEHIRTLAGQDIDITVRKATNRSNQQNRYYWGGVIPVVAEGLRQMGIRMTAEQTHDLLKYRFLKIEFVTDDGEVLQSMGRSKDLDTAEFNQYIEDIKQWAGEYLHIEIPEPNEQTHFEL